MLPTRMRRVAPWLVIVVVLAAAAYQLRRQGRLWTCSCDYLLLWAGDPWSSDNSQHLLDPYTFTHALHGFVFCGLLALVVPRLSPAWRLCVAVALEALWEIVENSEFVIRRYREETAALGYQGDTIVNSVSDIVVCALGFALAYRIGLRYAAALFLITEIVLGLWIRDGLVLNVIMLVYPIDAIREWQAAGH
jgi:hypothetical protein